MEEVVILFGGGDGGGVRITDKGLAPIPIWNPELRTLARGIGALSRVSGADGRGAAQEAEKISADLITTLREQLKLSGTAPVGFISDVDDWFCGNGRKPWPIPHGQFGVETVAAQSARQAVAAN